MGLRISWRPHSGILPHITHPTNDLSQQYTTLGEQNAPAMHHERQSIMPLLGVA